jgi:hypothetical protein
LNQLIGGNAGMKKKLGGCPGYRKQNGCQGNIYISEPAGMSTAKIHLLCPFKFF